MNYIAFDVETHIIKPGMTAPRLVCLSWATRSSMVTDDVFFEAALRNHYFGESGLLGSNAGLRFIRRNLSRKDVTLIGHNVSFDLAVCVAEDPLLLEPAFEAISDGRIRDTLTREQLLAIACGELKMHEEEDKDVKTEFSLQALVRRHFRRFLPKTGDSPEDPAYWRLRYSQFSDVPVYEWPEAARRYAIQDSIETDQIFWAQVARTKALRESMGLPGDRMFLPNEVEQTRAAWVLHLMGLWGIRTDRESVQRLREILSSEYEDQVQALIRFGLMRPEKRAKRDPSMVLNGPSKDLKAIRDRVVAAHERRVAEAKVIGEALPVLRVTGGGKTGKQAVSTERDVLEASQDPGLGMLAEMTANEKLLKTYVPALEQGSEVPINARFNALVETGRTSCSGPNLQNPPRKHGIRECFVARPGYVFCSADYDSAELRSLAQVCLDLLGTSKLADVLNRGEDPHLAVAAQILGISTDEAVSRYRQDDAEVAERRQLAKIANFGYPGGMGALTFVEYARGYGVTITPSKALALKDNWIRAFPEMAAYFNRVSELCGALGEATSTQLRSGRIRGRARYTAWCNGYFQGLTADGAKAAHWDVSRECYLGSWEVPRADAEAGPERSPLYGSRPVIFLHDELILEVPNPPGNPEVASRAARRLSSVMIAAMKRYLPDVVVRASPVLMRRWYKGAKAIERNGVLLPVKPNPEREPESSDPRRRTWKAWVVDEGDQSE